MSGIEPTEASLEGAALLRITWSDGATLHYPAHVVRAWCPCAHCTESRTDGEAHLPFDGFAAASYASIEEVGTYALQIGFSDGHNLGIYPHERLREIGYPPGEEPEPATGQAPYEV